MFMLFWTSIVVAVLFAGTLKLLKLFSFIKWNPVGFVEKWGIEQANGIEKWLVLACLLFLLALILYGIMQFVTRVPALFTSILIGLAMAMTIEWIIFDLSAELDSFKRLSIPFIVMVIIACRFIFETAAFHRR